MLKFYLLAFLIAYAGVCNAGPEKELAYKAAFAEIEMDQIISDLKGVVEFSELTDLVIKADSLVASYKSALIKAVDTRLMKERNIAALEERVVEAIALDQKERNEYGWDFVGHSPITNSLIEELNVAVNEKNEAVEREFSIDKGLIMLSTKRDYIKKYVDARIGGM
ncbi:hypothetical protein ACF8PU_04125 [Pseudomonas sp. GLN_6]|uniref:hypothetical protein n=1 Tax=Pseudomonas sp. GLN_6 TaxID=3367183 RepID=UPI00370AD7A9